MKYNKKFRDLAMGALVFAATLAVSNQAMANDEVLDKNSAPVIIEKAVGNFLESAWIKTKQVHGKVIDKTHEVAVDAGVVLGKGMQVIGKGVEKLAEPENSQPSKKQEKTAKKTETKKSDPQVQKAEISQSGGENNHVAENLVKAKNEAVNLVSDLPSKLSVENNNVAGNLVKAKDEAVGLMNGLIGKWRSNPSDRPSNTNGMN